MRHTQRHARAGEDGMALIVTMFMVLIISMLAAAAMVSARTETLSSMNYRAMSQTRYAAESGVHRALNYLMYTYVKPDGIGPDLLVNYNATQSPVKRIAGGADVILSSTAAVASNYPIPAVQNAFSAAVQGTLNVTNGTVAYTATARMLSMRQFTDAFSNLPVTVQSWRVTGTGTRVGADSSAVEVSAVLEQPVVAMFRYAAFATSAGCDALSFAGGADTDSFDSRTALIGPTPVMSASGGSVGSNGNLSEVGNPTVIHGSLSTPRSGVGNCTANNVTAATAAHDDIHVDDGLIQLPQNVPYPTPAVPNPLPPTTAADFSKMGGCPAGLASCAASVNGATITPPTPTSVITLGNVKLTAQAELHVKAGIYVVNSISMVGNAKLIVDSGPVIFRVVGASQTTPLDLEGGVVSNPSFNPSNLQFVYGGTDHVKLAGGAENAALIYAPNADTKLTGSSDFYGSVVTGVLSATGGVSIHYDRALQKTMLTPGNTVMSEFTWKAF